MSGKVRIDLRTGTPVYIQIIATDTDQILPTRSTRDHCRRSATGGELEINFNTVARLTDYWIKLG